ncbi:hypothetical protein BZJ17_14970 [Salinivibrio sp. IB574]|uniref:hypothetical protein n=1 Tax=Salinivibrio sp. IB574 TaxID=1909444 RepID=UPI000988A702|nr:hypothetical protein [Salinivibrio sp. IB574]OOF19696.1 hypothetical protein BZJ17_14970 [Salinivibrio sp. IB574]
MNKPNYAKQIARTILGQFGGQRFIAMTGARQFVALPTPGVQFDLPARFARGGINRVQVVLDPCDTYTVTYMRINRRTFAVETVHQESDIYCDMLEERFEAVTGLVTQL